MASESRMADNRVFCDSECRLHKAAFKGEKRKLDELLRRDGVIVDQQNADGQTALYIASQRGHYSIVKRLIRNGADPNCRSTDGVTPVHTAAASGNAKLLGVLVLAGGDLRLHDFMGRSVRDWSDLQPNLRKRRNIYNFIEKMKHVAVETATGNSLLHETTVLLNQTMDGNKSIFKKMRSKKGPISLCQSTIFSNGFGKVVARADNSCGIMGQYHMITRDNLRYSTSSSFWENGAFTVMESMFWRDRPVTVKRLNGMMRDGGHVDLLIQELEQMHQLRHPAILYLIGTSRNDSMEDLTLVFEKIKFSSLYHNLHERHESLSLIQTSLMMGQISGALLYLHLNDLVHCNVTSHAVFLTDDFQAKLGNFEYMIHAKSGSTSRVTSHKYTNAFYNWMAPEVMKGEVPTFKSDLYSFSTIIWEIVIGDMPWRDMSAEVIMEQMLERGISLQSTLPNRTNKSLVIQPFKSIMDYGLQLQPCERLIELEEMEKSLSDFFTTNFYPPVLTRECLGSRALKTPLEKATPTSRFTFSDIEPRLTASSSSPPINDPGMPERPATTNLCTIVPPATRKRFSFRKNSGSNFFFSRKNEARESKSSAPTDTSSPDGGSRLNESSRGTEGSVGRMPRKLSLPPARMLKGCQQFLSKSFRAMSCKSATNEELGRSSSKTKNTQTDTDETKETDAARIYERFKPSTIASTTFSRRDAVENKADVIVSSVAMATPKPRDSPRHIDRFEDRNFSPDISVLSNEVDYSFIRNPLKRAFFESSPPAAGMVNPLTGRMLSPSPCGQQMALAGGSYSQASLSKFSYAWMPRPYQKPKEVMIERNLKKETEMFFYRRPEHLSAADLPLKPDSPVIDQQPYRARQDIYSLPEVVSPTATANTLPESRDSHYYDGFRGILKARDQRGGVESIGWLSKENESASTREPVETSSAEPRLLCRIRKMTDGDVANSVPRPFLKKQELCSSLDTGLGLSTKESSWKPAVTENVPSEDRSRRHFFPLELSPVRVDASKIRTSLSQLIGTQQGGLISVDAPLPYKPPPVVPEYYFSTLQKGGDGVNQQVEGEMCETKQLFSMSIKEFETKMQELWEDNEETNISKNRKPSEFGMARCSTRKAKTRSACSRRSPIMTAAEIKPWPVKCHSQYLLSSNEPDIRRQSLDQYEVSREEGPSFDGRWFSPCFARANSSQRRSMSRYYQFCFNGRNLEPSPIKKSFTELPSIGVKPASHSVQAKVLKSSCSYLSSSFEELISPSKRESNAAFEAHEGLCHYPHHRRLSPSRGSIKELVRNYQKMIDEHGRKQSFLQRIKLLREDLSSSAIEAVVSNTTSPACKEVSSTSPQKFQKEIMKSCFKNWKQSNRAEMEE